MIVSLLNHHQITMWSYDFLIKSLRPVVASSLSRPGLRCGSKPGGVHELTVAKFSYQLENYCGKTKGIYPLVISHSHGKWPIYRWFTWVYLLIAWWIFPWQTVSHNQRVPHFSHIHIISWLSHGRKHRLRTATPGSPRSDGWAASCVRFCGDGMVNLLSIWDPSINILMGKMGIIWAWTNSAINLGFDDLNPPICSLFKPPKRCIAQKKGPLWIRGRIEGNSWWVNHFVDLQAVGPVKLKKVGTTRDWTTSALTGSMDRPVNPQF